MTFYIITSQIQIHERDVVAGTGLCHSNLGKNFYAGASRNYTHTGTTQLGVDMCLGLMIGDNWEYFF